MTLTARAKLPGVLQAFKQFVVGEEPVVLVEIASCEGSVLAGFQSAKRSLEVDLKFDPAVALEIAVALKAAAEVAQAHRCAAAAGKTVMP